MENNQIIISEDRGLISLTGVDAKDFLQNILSNDVDKVDIFNSIFAAILSPQGK
jgi:folate-binding Fe-S cluster repair protein YgfZ